MNDATDDENDSLLKDEPFYEQGDFIGPESGEYELLSEERLC